MERILLVKADDGSYLLPSCADCRLHVWDGVPRTIDGGNGVRFKNGMKVLPGEAMFIGKLAPHVHLCEKHRNKGGR